MVDNERILKSVNVTSKSFLTHFKYYRITKKINIKVILVLNV